MVVFSAGRNAVEVLKGSTLVAMLPDDVQPADSVPLDKSEGIQPKEDPDRIRREVFKRMFPDVPEKPSE